MDEEFETYCIYACSLVSCNEDELCDCGTCMSALVCDEICAYVSCPNETYCSCGHCTSGDYYAVWSDVPQLTAGYSGNCTASSCPNGVCVAAICFDYSAILDCLEQCEYVECEYGYVCSCGTCLSYMLSLPSSDRSSSSTLSIAVVTIGLSFMGGLVICLVRFWLKRRGYHRVEIKKYDFALEKVINRKDCSKGGQDPPSRSEVVKKQEVVWVY